MRHPLLLQTVLNLLGAIDVHSHGEHFILLFFTVHLLMAKTLGSNGHHFILAALTCRALQSPPPLMFPSEL